MLHLKKKKKKAPKKHLFVVLENYLKRKYSQTLEGSILEIFKIHTLICKT